MIGREEAHDSWIRKWRDTHKGPLFEPKCKCATCVAIRVLFKWNETEDYVWGL